MLKRMINIINKNKLWLILLLSSNIMLSIFIWLIDENVFKYILPTMIIGLILIYCLFTMIMYVKEKRKSEAIINFVENPELKEEELCYRFLSSEEREIISLVGKELRRKEKILKKKNLNLHEYELYIETWAHEIKTPLALMTFVLDNRKDEIPKEVYNKLEYSRSKMQEDIERILYYERVESKNLDYIFSSISLNEICNDIISEYKNIVEEQNIEIINKVDNFNVISDNKGLLFILRQILSNSIKYVDKQKQNNFIQLSSKVDGKRIELLIRDNGLGVKLYDIPFLFNKGFTGDLGQYKKQSTGMGLYLANKVAQNLKIEMIISEEYKDGFQISLLFPLVM